MKRMANYDTYVLATVLPPAIIMCTILLSSYCAWGISYLMFTIQKRRARQNVTTNVVIEYPGLQYMYTVIQVVFGNRICARKTQDRVKVKLFGEEMSPGAIPLIVQLVALALGLSLAVFVTVLTVETGQVCDEKWDCFPFNYTQVRPLRTEPIQNCSVYQSNNNITIVCFHFTIRLIDALSYSGGILALTVIGINFYVAFVLTLVRVRFCRVKHLCGCLLVTLIGCIILLSTLLWILPLLLDQNETLKSVRNWESFLIYYYTVVYIIAAATALPFCVPRHLQDFGTCGSMAHRRYLGRDDESETPDEESSDDGESQPVQARATSNQNGNHAHQTSYYGLFREHQSSRERLNKPPSAVSQPSGDHEPQSEASDTPIASGAKKTREEINPLVTTAQPQHLTKRSSSKRASGSLRKNKAARKHREGRRRGRGGHWTNTKDRGSEEEWSTSENEYRHRNNGNKIENSSEEDEIGEHGPQGGAEWREGRAERMEGREGGREQESSRIRAVLTGEDVENGAKGGDVSVRTHL